MIKNARYFNNDQCFCFSDFYQVDGYFTFVMVSNTTTPAVDVKECRFFMKISVGSFGIRVMPVNSASLSDLVHVQDNSDLPSLIPCELFSSNEIKGVSHTFTFNRIQYSCKSGTLPVQKLQEISRETNVSLNEVINAFIQALCIQYEPDAGRNTEGINSTDEYVPLNGDFLGILLWNALQNYVDKSHLQDLCSLPTRVIMPDLVFKRITKDNETTSDRILSFHT